MKKALLLTLIIALSFQGCSTRNVKSSHYSKPKKSSSKKHTYKTKTGSLKELYAFYQAWKGTPYVYGGTTKKGADCSGFVMKGYSNVYHLKIARTTAQQVKQGKYINKSALRSGDLVFFKTGWNSRHVGIYLENSNFLHISTSRGVSISSLHNPYWKQAYWQSRRIR